VADAIGAVEQEAAESQEAKEARTVDNNAAGPSTPQEERGDSAKKAVTTTNNFYKVWQLHL
jgi:hypothetical protein